MVMKTLVPALFVILQLACHSQSSAPAGGGPVPAETKGSPEVLILDAAIELPPAEPEEPPQPYPGVTIDERFSLIESHDFDEKELKEKTYSVKAGKFDVFFKGFAPKAISKNGKTLFKFRTRYPTEYWSSAIGVSELRGRNSKEIYVVAVGPGAVCCTNYWIMDVSGPRPRNIFRSEDFGSFRDPLESFDADGDGVSELVQFDIAFRYFMDDCGACSPLPRAVFKYSKKAGRYLPAKGIQQDFIRKAFIATEKWLAESAKKLKKEPSPELELELRRMALNHVVDLIYLGKEKNAWRTFDKYYPAGGLKKEVRAKIRRRLRGSSFYQVLKRLG